MGRLGRLHGKGFPVSVKLSSRAGDDLHRRQRIILGHAATSEEGITRGGIYYLKGWTVDDQAGQVRQALDRMNVAELLYRVGDGRYSITPKGHAKWLALHALWLGSLISFEFDPAGNLILRHETLSQDRVWEIARGTGRVAVRREDGSVSVELTHKRWLFLYDNYSDLARALMIAADEAADYYLPAMRTVVDFSATAEEREARKILIAQGLPPDAA